jgi:hypothetical protein
MASGPRRLIVGGEWPAPSDDPRFCFSRASGGGFTNVNDDLPGLLAGHPREASGVPVREYSLVVEGELSDELGSVFAGMTLTRKDGTTVLVGQVRDQAELQGLLQRISSLGLTLISVSTTDANGGGEN